ncbi:SGNH/GDSL hydrolase family protein [Pseudomonas sp. ChxA]|uniref:SGNH/GDSL hydrolase family protein n=1 Tax=Pseudomonas sp. ChxA TaxID=3035473 RepID=UPI0025533546|nr:SGNH/GDSL hydrolase family protein [Pseudomonas sp. ChxA]MDL2186704.1 SGNH/GDSL hydrolase family protein [Pseudomonas sp. ChxA]
MAYNTGNPVEPNGSSDPRDLKDNAQIIDKLVNGSELTWAGRIGKIIKTWAGMEKDFSDLLLRSGFESVYLQYGAGVVVNRATQLVQRNGELFRVTDQAVLPLSLTGTWATDAPKLTAVGDASVRAALLTAAGASMVGEKKSTPSAVLQTQHDINAQTVLFSDYGGKDDWNGTSGTNNFGPLNSIRADFTGTTTVWFKKSVGGTGVFMINGTIGDADMSRFTFKFDEGVSFHLIGTSSPLMGKGLKFDKPVSMRMSLDGFTRRFSSQSYGPLAGKPVKMSANDGESPITERIITSTALQMSFQSISLTDGSKTSTTANTDGNIASFSSMTASTYVVASSPIRPGQEVHAQVTSTGFTAGQINSVAYIETEGGWVMFAQNGSGGTFTRYVYLKGFPIQTVSLGDPFSDAPAYKMAASEIGIKVHGPRSFSLLLNHVEIFRMDPDNLTSDILRAGWGAGGNSTAGTAYVSYPYRVRAKRSYGVAPRRVVILGDSTADFNNSFSFVNHFERAVAGIGGIQIKTMINLAVAGQTTLQQRDILNQTDIQALGGADICLIATGINDQGGNVLPADYIQAIIDINARCQFFGMIPIFALHSMYYSRASAAPFGQIGLDSAYEDRGAPYRTQLVRKLSELGLQSNFFTIEDMGAILPSSLASPRLNPVLDDNVHFSNFGSEQVGMGWAKAVAGLYFARVRKDIDFRSINRDWTPAAQQSTYGNLANSAFGIRGDQFYMGNDFNVPASPPLGTVLFKLPTCYAPQQQIFAWCAGAPSGTPGSLSYSLQVLLRVDPDGSVYTQAPVANLVYINMSALQWALKS